MKEQLIAAKNKVKNAVESIPEFSESNYPIAGYIFATLITLSGAFLIYEVLSTDALTFKAQWNMFKSPLGNLCYFIGLIWAIAWWGKFTHWSATPVKRYVDSSGRVIREEEDYDAMEQGFAKFLMPFIGHFIIEPIMYGAIIYYPIQCIIAVVGAIFPYVLSLIVIAIMVGSWLYTKKVTMRYRSALLVVCGLVFTLAFSLGGYAIHRSGPGATIQMLADTQGEDYDDEEDEFDEDEATGQEATDSGAEAEDEFADEEDESESQFEGYGEEGLLGSLPDGRTEYAGEMSGFPIELAIVKGDEGSSLTAFYKNVKYGTTMRLDGESLPAQGGDINFYGQDGKTDWIFSLTGTANHITGTAQADGKSLDIMLDKK